MAELSPKRWLALIGISILSFVVFIDFTIVNTILPGIQRDLHASVDELQWVMNAFFLMLTVFMVTMGRLGDIYGRRRVLYTGVIVFALASLLAGPADSPQFLIACRFAQGIAGAIMLTCAVGLVTQHFPENEQGRALAVFMSVTGFGMAVGPVLGGASVGAILAVGVLRQRAGSHPRLRHRLAVGRGDAPPGERKSRLAGSRLFDAGDGGAGNGDHERQQLGLGCAGDGDDRRVRRRLAERFSLVSSGASPFRSSTSSSSAPATFSPARDRLDARRLHRHRQLHGAALPAVHSQ